MPIVFLGDSHAHALIKAIKQENIDDIVAIDTRRWPGHTTNVKTIDPRIATEYKASSVYCCFGGTEYNFIGLIETPERFDFLETPDGAFDESRAIMPHGLVKSALAHRMQSAIARMMQARALYDVPFTYVTPPPPFSDLDNEAVLPRAFQPFAHLGITPASIRLKLYRLQNALMVACCEEAGIGFMEAPVAASDAEGLLLRSCWDRDPTHGNSTYGAMLIEQIRKAENANSPSLQRKA